MTMPARSASSGRLRCETVDRLLERYLRAGARRGRRLADIKPPVLITDAAILKP